MSIFSSIGRFFEDPNLEKITGFIDGILSTPSTIKDTSSEQISGDFINDVFNKQEDKNDLDSFLSQFSVPAERLLRYSSYEEIYKSVSMIKRVIKVYKPYVIQKNPVTGLWYLLKTSDLYSDKKFDDEQKAEDSKKFFNNVIKNFDLQNKLKNQFIHNQLLFGDYFVEVVDLKKEKEKIKDLKQVNILNEVHLQNLLNESSKLDNSSSTLQIDTLINRFLENCVTINEGFVEEETNADCVFKNTILKGHLPHNIIVLETKYGTVIGYLEVSKSSTNDANASISQALSSITSRLISVTSSRETKINDGKEYFVNKIINFILRRVNDKNYKFNDETIDNLKRLIIEQGLDNKKFNLKPLDVRFIPASRMVSFNLPSSENHPYGSSIIETLLLPGKLFILSQLSNIFMKLSRAPLNRKWIIDTGSVQMPSALIQKLKRELKNNRIAIEDMSSFKSISKIMSDYKDFFILSKNNQRALDVEINSLGDSTIKTADLEDARREIIALSGVPAPYLGYADVVELREQLIHANVSFATEIVDIQDNINLAINKLVDIIAKNEGVDFVPSKYYQFSLIPPVVLMVQLIEMTMSSVGNIFGILQAANVQFDPYYFFKQYIPYINWDDFKTASEEYQRKTLVKSAIESSEASE